MASVEPLACLPYFKDLDPSVVATVEQKTERVKFAADTVIIEEDSSADEMFVILSGNVDVTKMSQGRDVVLASLGPGDVVGEMALLDGTPRTATVRTSTEAEMVLVPATAVEDLLRDPALVQRMFKTVTSRLRGIEDTLRHEERMSALGRMAAQLMHELNNPAAAVGRSSSALGDVHRRLGIAATEMVSTGAQLGEQGQPPEPDSMDSLTRSDREDEVADVLSRLGVDDPWDLAPALVADGWGSDDLTQLVDSMTDEQARAAAQWIGLRSMASELISELRIGANRISELVRVVKDYSFLDQAPIQTIDPTDGIADTLILLKPKLREIEVVTELADDLHHVEASGRDLNQVWTNLIDNAADAMGEKGKLEISAFNDGEDVVVKITDSGEGIDPAHAEKLFDPFFTTKEPGKGTGLGLHTVYTIISRAGGTISAESNENGTTFTLRLPRAEGADSG